MFTLFVLFVCIEIFQVRITERTRSINFSLLINQLIKTHHETVTSTNYHNFLTNYKSDFDILIFVSRYLYDTVVTTEFFRLYVFQCFLKIG